MTTKKSNIGRVRGAAWEIYWIFVVIFVFGVVYYILLDDMEPRTSNPLDALYFSCSQTCVGFANLHPRTNRTKVVVMIQQLLASAIIFHVVINHLRGNADTPENITWLADEYTSVT